MSIVGVQLRQMQEPWTKNGKFKKQGYLCVGGKWLRRVMREHDLEGSGMGFEL